MWCVHGGHCSYVYHPPPLFVPSPLSLLQSGADVFNALDVMENASVFEELKFGRGDGNLHYYFYNWKCPELPPHMVSHSHTLLCLSLCACAPLLIHVHV